MTTIREQITASVFSLVQSTAGLGGRVYRSPSLQSRENLT
jgi:hypothetical protein